MLVMIYRPTIYKLVTIDNISDHCLVLVEVSRSKTFIILPISRCILFGQINESESESDVNENC